MTTTILFIFRFLLLRLQIQIEPSSSPRENSALNQTDVGRRVRITRRDDRPLARSCRPPRNVSNPVTSFARRSRTMAPPAHGETTNGNERVNIRINDTTALNLHKAAVTRDYIKQPRISKFFRLRPSPSFDWLD